MFNLSSFISHHCAYCELPHKQQAPLCQYCEQDLVRLEHYCYYCATPISADRLAICGHCIKTPPILDYLYAPFTFNPIIQKLLHRLKYQEQLGLINYFAEKMIAHLPASFKSNQCLIPVPSSIERLKTRGFNQSVELAKILGKRLSLPVDIHSCKKTKHTPAQVGLNRTTRQKNLNHAFSMTATHYSHITLIDDLTTTGSTLQEIAKTLKMQGVKTVGAWCVAKA